MTLAEKTKAFIKANLYRSREGAFDKINELNSVNAITSDEYAELVIAITLFYDSLTEQDKIDILTEENKMLTAKIETMSYMQDFYEECIIEMATIVYA